MLVYCAHFACRVKRVTRRAKRAERAGGQRIPNLIFKMAEDLYCICRKPYDYMQFMIQCDACDDWFHGR